MVYIKLLKKHTSSEILYEPDCAVHSCRYDGTVRNSAGDVVQFLYGEDGMDAVRIEEQVSAAS